MLFPGDYEGSSFGERLHIPLYPLPQGEGAAIAWIVKAHHLVSACTSLCTLSLWERELLFPGHCEGAPFGESLHLPLYPLPVRRERVRVRVRSGLF